MEILNKDQLSSIDKRSVVSIGNFDGLHLGHQGIIELVNNIAKKELSKSVIVTFNPHPAEFFDPDIKNHSIDSIYQKTRLFEELGIDYLCIVDFDKSFSSMSADDFIREFVCNKMNPSNIVVGYDHCFGKDRLGSIDLLNQYADELNYKVHSFGEMKINGKNVKSSIVRELIKDGDLMAANQFLGRRFSVIGKVVSGEGLGKKLSFPTANIELDNSAQLLPRDGVYHTAILIGGDRVEYNSVCNIGFRPTLREENKVKTVEVHILSDKSFDIYGEDVELVFKERIRDEKKFNDKKELINQINLDKEYCINN